MKFCTLASAASTWLLLHVAVAGTGLRRALVRRFGEKSYRAGFSLASLVALWWLIHEYGRAPYIAFWEAPRLLAFVPLVIVPVALVLSVGAFMVPNPTAVGGERWLAGQQPARGVLRITRHPFLWSAVLWALSHLIVNGDVGSLFFFGSLGLTALFGTADIDRKRRLSNPVAFAEFEANTSNVPFRAVLAGRNRMVWRELWLPLLLGLLLAVVAIALHPRLFGGSALSVLHG